MKKSLIVVLVILVTVTGWQTYRIYQLKNQIKQLRQPSASSSRNSFFTPSFPDPAPFGNNSQDPYQEFQHMQQELEKDFGEAFSGFDDNGDPDEMTKMPDMHIKEEADRYVVTLNAPDADMSSMSIKLDGRQLSISMKTERESTDQNSQNFTRSESYSGSFQRSLTLPGPVNSSGMTNEYKDGVLTIEIPKA